MKPKVKDIQRLLVLTMATVIVTSLAAPVYAAELRAMQEGECGDMDLVFIVDDTGSMGPAIDNVKAELPTIIAQAELASTALEAGLITFKDGVEVDQKLTSVIADVEAAILALSASGGVGEPEASNEAKNTAINNLLAGIRADVGGTLGAQTGDFDVAWDGDTNIAILITDATSGGFDDTNDPADNAQMASLGTAAAAHVPPIRMSDVFIPTGGDKPVAETAMTDDASNSGGIFLKIAADGSGTADAILDIIAACGQEEPVGGSSLSLDTTALFVAGIFANAFWMIPTIAGIAGAGVYFTKSRCNKTEAE